MEKGEYLYLAAFIFSIMLCLVMFATTTFYSQYYSTSNVISLPRNLPTIALSIFNGYNENIPFNHASGGTPINIPYIQASSLGFVKIVVFEILLATIVIIIFDILYRSFGIPKANRGKRVNRELFISFFLALLVSQYIEASFYFLTKGIPYSGISLFEVQATLTSLAFISITGITVMSRAFRISILKRPKPTALHVIEAILFIIYLCFIEVFTATVLLPALDVVFSLTSFGALSISSYGAHWSALVLFSMFFVMFYAYFKMILPEAVEAGRRKYK
jgi:hypothetical protein